MEKYSVSQHMLLAGIQKGVATITKLTLRMCCKNRRSNMCQAYAIDTMVNNKII